MWHRAMLATALLAVGQCCTDQERNAILMCAQRLSLETCIAQGEDCKWCPSASGGEQCSYSGSSCTYECSMYEEQMMEGMMARTSKSTSDSDRLDLILRVSLALHEPKTCLAAIHTLSVHAAHN